MIERTYLMPKKTSYKTFSRNILLLLSFTFILVVSLIVFNSSSNKVQAATINPCGINTHLETSYAGMIVYLQWHTAANPTTYMTAHGVTATIHQGVVPPGAAFQDNILEWSVASHPRTTNVTLSQTSQDCSNDGSGDYQDPVVLAYTSGADGLGGGYASPGDYVLDCEGEYTTNNTLTQFVVTANGTPTGAPTGGTWDQQTVNPRNGYTTVVILTYTTPQPLATIEGTVTTKTLPNGTAPGLAGAYIGIDDTTSGTYTESSVTGSNGHYSVSVPVGDTFTLFVVGATVPNGYTGPYTDYQGPASFTANSGAYNCSQTQYSNQVAGASQSLPSSSSCETVGSNSLYDFIYTSGGTPPPANTCSSLTASGTSPQFHVTADYTVSSGVSYKGLSVDWGDGTTTTTTTGVNNGSSIVSTDHTYTGTGSFTVVATMTFTSSTGVPPSMCQTTITIPGSGGGCVTNCGPGGGGCVTNCNPAPTAYVCTTAGGAYNINFQPNPSPVGGYIGADYSATSLTFTSSGGFDSDANHNITLPSLSSSVTITANNSLGLTADGPINFTGSGLNITLPITHLPGIYTNSVNYSANIVTVTKMTDTTYPMPAPPAGYSPASSVSTPVDTDTETSAGNPSVYLTTVTTTTVNTYTKTMKLTLPVASGCVETSPTTEVCTTTTQAVTEIATWQTVSTTNAPCPQGTVKIADQPYMKVYGGDVMAGSGFISTGSTTCTPGTTGSVVGWNWPTSGYSGAGNEFAAFGLGDIDGFATDQNSGNSGIGLSFANSPATIQNNVAPGSGEFGGLYNPVNCAPNFYSTMPATTSAYPGSVGGLLSGAYSSNADLTIGGGSVQDSQHPVIYVNGNVYISGNINLGTASDGDWANISDIPSFELIVQGNIYISSTVTNLDGIYIAQGGTIYDCSTGLEAPAALDSSFYSTCNQKLTVNGSFIATSVDLMRTDNTLYQSSGESSAAGGGSSSHAAEVFNYNPTIWLGLTTNNTQLNNYNSIISLPPVL